MKSPKRIGERRVRRGRGDGGVPTGAGGVVGGGGTVGMVTGSGETEVSPPEPTGRVVEGVCGTGR